MTSGGSVIAIKYDGGVFMASDTLLSYGSLAKVPNVPRSKIIGKYAAVCATGDYADFQNMTQELQEQVTAEELMDDGHEMSPPALFSLLQRSLYSKRSDFEPCLCQFIMIGNRNGQSFCGGVTDIGTCWVDDYAAQGYGQDICVPLIRRALEVKNGKLTRTEALQVVHDCLRAIFYRECRAVNRFQVVEAANNKVTISDPFTLDTQWEREGYSFEKTAIIR